MPNGASGVNNNGRSNYTQISTNDSDDINTNQNEDTEQNAQEFNTTVSELGYNIIQQPPAPIHPTTTTADINETSTTQPISPDTHSSTTEPALAPLPPSSDPSWQATGAKPKTTGAKPKTTEAKPKTTDKQSASTSQEAATPTPPKEQTTSELLDELSGSMNGLFFSTESLFTSRTPQQAIKNYPSYLDEAMDRTLSRVERRIDNVESLLIELSNSLSGLQPNPGTTSTAPSADTTPAINQTTTTTQSTSSDVEIDESDDDDQEKSDSELNQK